MYLFVVLLTLKVLINLKLIEKRSFTCLRTGKYQVKYNITAHVTVTFRYEFRIQMRVQFNVVVSSRFIMSHCRAEHQLYFTKPASSQKGCPERSIENPSSVAREIRETGRRRQRGVQKATHKDRHRVGDRDTGTMAERRDRERARRNEIVVAERLLRRVC